MRVAMEEAAADTVASAEALVSAAVRILVEAVVPTAGAGGITHPEFRRDATAVTDKGTTHRERRLEARFMVPTRGRKVEPVPGSLLVRRIIPVATMSREINRELALPGNQTCSPGIIRDPVAMFAGSAPE
jgi:hypothetical protein